MILKLNNANSHATIKDQAITASVEDALRLGCTAVGFTMYPGSDEQFEMIEEIREIALEAKNPTILALTRQGLQTFTRDSYKENLVNKGAYLIKNYSKYHASIFASGSEVEIAFEASIKLQKININLRVISFPSMELFEMQDESYKKENQLEGKNIVMYAGNLGHSQPLEIMVNAAKTHFDKEDLIYVVNGSGVKAEYVKEEAEKLSNLIFVDFQPLERLPNVLEAFAF